MPSFTLYYFNGRGRAEISRLLFAAAGVQYTDKRIDFSEWNQFRTKMPSAMLPVLEIDTKTQIPESMAIARYLAREFGFHGRNNMDMVRIDYISDCFYDILDDYMRLYHEKDGRLYAQTGQKCEDCDKTLTELNQRFQETCARILPFMEKTLETNYMGNQFFMGEQLTMADLMCFAALENPVAENPNLLKEYPKLQALRTRVAVHPKISAYFKKRAPTDF